MIIFVASLVLELYYSVSLSKWGHPTYTQCSLVLEISLMICMVHNDTMKFLKFLLECFVEPAKQVFDVCECIVNALKSRFKSRIQSRVQSSLVIVLLDIICTYL